MHLKTDLEDLATRYLDLVVAVIQESPKVALEVFAIRNEQMVYLFGRMSAEQRATVLDHSQLTFGHGGEVALRQELAHPDDVAAARHCGLPDGFVDAATELQFDTLVCLREEARRDAGSAGLAFGIRDLHLLEAIRDATTSRLHRLARANLFLRMTPAPAFYLLVKMVVAESTNPQRLGIAGLGVMAYEGAAA